MGEPVGGGASIYLDTKIRMVIHKIIEQLSLGTAFFREPFLPPNIQAELATESRPSLCPPYCWLHPRDMPSTVSGTELPSLLPVLSPWGLTIWSLSLFSPFWEVYLRALKDRHRV